ncbi:hypothetical protein B7R54_02360 [Subtercola boreus]|uniref:Alkaline shock response membrane anchor protein AmaP n=1 Tax=Subtercola boreus TaxID=120213 RepID=A0A3E0VEU7_9MICO|nr:hypothetical protein [Subtercola boreus]RFA08189.1 hypothetical protein B7R54_02360 [Subtercola boreus]TQL54918.1 hypothetical protein FB464_2468 [Subtercola boreus]
MNSTNRFLNRFFLFIIGLVVLAAGAVLAVGALLPDLQQPISEGAQTANNNVQGTFSANPWILWVTAATALVLIVVLLWFVFRQGRGRTQNLLTLRQNSTANTPIGGDLLVDVKVAAQVLEDALTRQPEIAAVDVVAFEVRKQNVLRITAHARKGASPVRIRTVIDSAVTEWDDVLGQTTPVVIQIVSGLRASVASSSTRVA